MNEGAWFSFQCEWKCPTQGREEFLPSSMNSTCAFLRDSRRVAFGQKKKKKKSWQLPAGSGVLRLADSTKALCAVLLTLKSFINVLGPLHAWQWRPVSGSAVVLPTGH